MRHVRYSYIAKKTKDITKSKFNIVCHLEKVSYNILMLFVLNKK